LIKNTQPAKYISINISEPCRYLRITSVHSFQSRLALKSITGSQLHHANPSRTPFFAPLETYDPIHYFSRLEECLTTAANHTNSFCAAYLTVPPAAITNACFEYRRILAVGYEVHATSDILTKASLCFTIQFNRTLLQPSLSTTVGWRKVGRYRGPLNPCGDNGTLQYLRPINYHCDSALPLPLPTCTSRGSILNLHTLSPNTDMLWRLDISICSLTSWPVHSMPSLVLSSGYVHQTTALASDVIDVMRPLAILISD
jgi:hypothetical protein